MSGARESCAVDRRHLCGSRTIDRHEHCATWRCAVRAGVNHDILHVARSRLKRGVAKAGVRAIESAVSAESRESVRISSVGRPETGGEEALTTENPQVVRLGDGARDVIPAAVLIFGDGDFHSRIFSVDLRLQAAEKINRSAAKFLVNPGIAVS